jgi:sugar/nucleoside kinase (ribokinase family)
VSEIKYDVLGIGNAIVDILLPVDEEFIVAEGMRKGSMQLIDTARATALYDKLPPGTEASGGCAGNTVAGVASLGGKAAFIGLVANDQLGEIFRHDITANGITFTTPAVADGLPTARCFILVTPDAERTMNTYLGVAATLGTEQIDAALVEAAKVTYLEGFLFDSPPGKAAFFKAGELTAAAGRKLALTLSDAFCVNTHRADFKKLVEQHVDILFANEAEIRALYETDFDTALAIVRGKVGIACITRGAAGSVIVRGDETVQVAAMPTTVVDTTGAGDLYAAGFLYGYTQGMSLADCGRHAAIAAAEVISHMGARPLVNLGELVKQAA